MLQALGTKQFIFRKFHSHNKLFFFGLVTVMCMCGIRLTIEKTKKNEIHPNLLLISLYMIYI